MEDTRRRRSGGLRKLITAVFAVAFVASIISTVTAFAAANLFKIENAELSELSTTAEGSISSFDETNIVSNVTFHKLNDSAKYTITLKNTDTNDHVIESITDDNESPYISYEYDQHANEQINAGENLVFEVTAKYTTAITDINQRAQATNVKFFIHFTDLEEEIPIVPNTGTNPNTGDYIHFSVLSLVISAAGLTIIGIIALKKHKKASKFIAAGIITVATIATTATVKAATVEINSFTINTSYALNDRLIVTYTDKNGDEQELIVNYGEPANIPDQSKDGYTLTGWEDENGNPVDLTQPITEDIKIHPAYRAHTYTIKFNGNGATSGEMTDLAMTFGEAKTLPANAFTWAGHEYTGWDTEANGSGAHYGDAAEVTDLTTEDNAVVVLYAQWSVNPFHIDYDGNGATSGEMATTNCEYDQACQLRDNAFEKYGYDFAGWKYNDTIYADKADVTNIIDHGTITMQAQWTPHVYTITYTGLTSEEATTLRTAGNPDTYTIESPSFMLKNPENRKDADGDTRERFVGWVEVIEPSTSVTLPMVGNLGNKTFNATWEAVALPEYNITYDYDGGNVATANPTKLTKEQSATLNEPVKTGYTFTGWTGTTISGDTPVKPYTIPAPHQKGDLEYTAHYQAHTYTIAFDKNADDATGDTASMSMTYDEAKNLAANAFTRTGYTFAGWKLGDTEYSDGQTVKNLTAEDGATVTLKAQWVPTQYTIIFHANNDNVENPDAMAEQVVTYDEEVALNANTYTWWQHKLVEWTTNANGTGTKYDNKATIKNLCSDACEIHLYAKWREIDAALDGRGSGYDIAIKNKLVQVISENPDAKYFDHYPNGEPSDEIKANAMDLSGTIDPIYAWGDGENIYWWSEDDKPRISTTNKLENHYNGVGDHLEVMNLTGFDTSGITDAHGAFGGSEAKKIDISDWDLSNVTSAWYFAFGSKTEEIIFPEHFDVQKVTTFAGAFNGAKLKKLDLSGWITRDVTNLDSFATGMSNLTEITFGENFKTDNVTSMTKMISANQNLTTINNLNALNTANVINMSSMFEGDKALTSLDLSTFNTSSLTKMDSMFKDMTALSSLTLGGSFKAENVTSMISTFYGIRGLSTLDLSNLTSKPTTFGSYNNSNFGAFANMGSTLKTIDISGMDLSNLTNIGQLFHSTGGLQTVYVSNSVDIEKITDNSGYVFYGASSIVGGAGTIKDGSFGNATKAIIDDPCNGLPGYFTKKNAQYICFHANNGTDARKGQYVSTTASDQLEKNEFTHEGFRFLGWAESDDATAPLYTDEAAITLAYIGKEPKNLYAVWEPETYTISFDKNDEYAEGEMGTQTVTYTATETLNANTFTNHQHTFLGWNTQADGKGTHYDNHAEIEITTPNDFTLYAEWKAELQSAHGNSIDLTMLSADKANEDVQIDEDTKCKRAIQLHEEICESGHCTDLGYTETGSKGTNVVRYGSFGTQGGPLNSGDAFTCDVDGNGVFDEKYERFYYVSDYWNTKTREFEGDTAVLIYYRSTYLGQGTTSQMTSSYSSQVTSGPTISNLPKSSLWQNVSLKNTKRNILAFREGEEMAITIEDFDYDGYSARLLTIPEAKAGCNVATIQGGGAETDSTCMYMYENSRFVLNDFSTESIGVPLENTYIGTTSSEDNYRWFIQSRNAAGFHPTSASTRVSMRPVIEVPKDKISY